MTVCFLGVVSLDGLASGVVAALAALFLPQAVLTAWFVRLLTRRPRAAPRPEAASMPAEVVLCLKGRDPQLEEVFVALAGQQHADWRLRIVVDSTTDPAWDVAREATARLERDGLASWKTCTIEPLARRPATGSLKCASLRQALVTLHPATRVAALVDADAVVHDRWLVTLVEACLEQGVGAVSGNRWYEPERDSVAGTVRAVWNGGAIVQMAAFGIPWGGSLAIRREAIDATGWCDLINGTLCEDTALAAPLARAGWRYRFLPSIFAVDTDDAETLRPLIRWIARQLLTARLHHPRWLLVAVHGLGTSLALVLALIVALLAWRAGRGDLAGGVLTAVVAYEVGSIALLLSITLAVRRVLVADGRPLRALTAARAAWLGACVPLTQCVYAVATLMALTARTVEWRGVVYEIVWGRDADARAARRAAVRITP
jgi:hypothetical protein